MRVLRGDHVADRQQPEEPTRDEIREACEAVPGWKWVDGDPDRIGFIAEVDHVLTADGKLRAIGGVLVAKDAIALLKATGEPFSVYYQPGQHDNDWWEAEVGEGVIRPDGSFLGPPGGEGPTLPAAAVRAVLAWAKTVKGSKR